MFQGFWIVQFAGMEGKGGGVVVLIKGKIFGGDSAYTYIGSYQEENESITATVKVQNFDPLMGNVLGIKGDFTLQLQMKSEGKDILRGQASTSAAPGFGLKAKLTRSAMLPV